jgi:hypothetical protein
MFCACAPRLPEADAEPIDAAPSGSADAGGAPDGSASSPKADGTSDREASFNKGTSNPSIPAPTSPSANSLGFDLSLGGLGDSLAGLASSLSPRPVEDVPTDPFPMSPEMVSEHSTKTLQELVDDSVLCGLPEKTRAVLEAASRMRLQQDKLFAAEREVHALVRRLEAESDKDLLARVQSTTAYKALVEDVQLINNDLLALLDDEGWTSQKEANNIHVWTKPEPGTDAVSVRIAGVMEGPFAEYNAIGKEIAMYKDWMWGVKESRVLEERSPFEVVAYYSWRAPLINAREFLIQDRTYVNDEVGYSLNRRHPPRPREDFKFDVPLPKKNHIRCVIEKSISLSVPLGKDKSTGNCRTFAVIVLNIDMKMPLPKRLTNMLSVKVGYDSFVQSQGNLRKAQEPTNPWHLSVENPINASYYKRMIELERIRESRPLGCVKEILETGWVKDPKERRKMFERSEDVLVPL